MIGKLAGALALALVVMAACDMNGVPNVEGTYTGRVTVAAPELDISVVGQMRVVAKQSGSQVTLSGSQTFGDITSGLTATTGTISATGVFTAEESGLIDAEEALQGGLCGSLRPISSSVVFADGRLEMEASVRSSVCRLITYHANLSR